MFQPKTSTFSTRTLIWVHFKTVHKFSQPIFSLFSYLKNVLHNLVIELCRALLKCENNLKIGCCIWMKITMTAMIERQRARFYIHKKQKLRNVFIYKKRDTFQKARQFPLRFYIQKAIHFTLRDFSWNFWSWHFYWKSMTLCVTWSFYIQKSRHLAKSKTICDTFLYEKKRHFASRDFLLNFLKLAEGVGHLGIKKTMHFVWYFYIGKTMHFALRCFIQRAWHYELHFNKKKTMHFSLCL